jgi:hypothetical protein
MSIIKAILFVVFIFFIISLVRIIISLFRFGSFVRRVNRTGNRPPDNEKTKPDERSYSRDKRTITLGKDDYHVD